MEYLKQQMEEIGLAVRVDNSGAVIGRLEGEDPDAPAILIGSHYDTVKSGGAYDGIAGVVSAIEGSDEDGRGIRVFPPPAGR